MIETPAIPPLSRRHDLDALRAFAMLLGIALHAALSFAEGSWLVQDTKTGAGFGLLVTAVHGFRMPLFFLLSGFFTAMLWRRRGLKALIRHRFLRIVLPLLFCMVTIVPAMHWVAGLALREAGTRSAPLEQRKAADVWSASAKGDVHTLERLMDEGAEFFAPDPKFGVTPLGYACLYGHQDVVARLIERGADVNARHRDGGTALHTAAFLGREELVRMLLAAGADAAIENERGETALDASRTNGQITRFVIRATKVVVDEESLRNGRESVQKLLGGGGEGAVQQTRPLLGLWLFATQFPLFHHLWFLWFLCWMVAGFSAVAWVARKLGWESKERLWVGSLWRYAWLIPLTMIPAWLMGRVMPNFGPDTSTALLPPLPLLVYYAVFFGFGALYYDSGDDGGKMGKYWWLTLPVSLFVLYPVGLSATFEGGDRWRWMAVTVQVMYVWAMSSGMMGLFRRFVSAERKWVRYLSDASYWMYVAHLPLVLAAQLWVRDWPLSAGLKFLFVCGSVGLVLLVSYEWVVRYTWIGAMLNGRKVRGAA